jgi:adenylate cyclase
MVRYRRVLRVAARSDRGRQTEAYPSLTAAAGTCLLTLCGPREFWHRPADARARAVSGVICSTHGLGAEHMSEDRVERRLAAILAADIAGYSRLMGEDEEGTLAALKAIRRELTDPKVTEHRGRIVKTTGDGVLVEFASVIDAVRCAVDIQREMAARNAEIADEQRIEFRIGINVGDIIIDEGDIYGEGVNVAARLETLAQPGGICVSRVVRDHVRDKLDFGFDDRGEQQVKNIARPIRAFAVAFVSPHPSPAPPAGEGNADSARVGADAPAPPAEKPSIAVLPFQNLGGDPEQEYFADGIVEDIITALSRNRAFFVISRNTSFTYKGPAVDVARVARELGVRYVLEGSVRKAGNRVRITAQLIDAASGRHLWADRYDRDLADIFEVQDEIARTITGELAPGIIAAEMQQARRKDSGQLDAWDRTMRAHWHIRRFTRDDLAEACRLLEEAIRLDPTSGMAFADLAFASHFDAVFGWTDDPAQTFARCGEAARRAVALDDSDAHAHGALAIFDLFSGRHEEARRRLLLALDLDPNSVTARGYLGVSYGFAGDYEATLPQIQEAIRLSPRDPMANIWPLVNGWAALLSERDAEAVEFAKQANERNGEFPDNYAVLASAYGHLGDAVAARAALDEFLRRSPVTGASDERLNRPFARPELRERFLAGLRKAGLPEG